MLQQMLGFVKLLTAADIPPGGRNNFFSPKVDSIPEEVGIHYFNVAHNIYRHSLLYSIILYK